MIRLSSKSYGVNPELALKIAKCESQLRQFNEEGKILRGIYNTQDVGVFQINENFHLSTSQEKGYDIYTAKGNIDYAMYLLSKQGSKPWIWSKNCWGEATLAAKD